MLEVQQSTQWQAHEIMLAQGIKEVRVNQGELWTISFHNLCLSARIKVTALLMQQHTDNAFTKCAMQSIQKVAQCRMFDSNVEEQWWPYTISQAAYICNWLAGTTQGNKTPFKVLYGKTPNLCNVCHFGCIAYVVLCGNTKTTWLCNNLTASKHLHPCTLQGMYLGYSSAAHAIKGHQVWLKDLDHIVIAKDICFSELEGLNTGAQSLHTPVFSGENDLLCLYSWLPTDDELPDPNDNDIVNHSLPFFSRHNDNEELTPFPEWDQIMSEIQEASEIVIDMDAIHTDLHHQLNEATAKGGTSTTPGDPNDTSQLESPQFSSHNDYMLPRPKSLDNKMPDPLTLCSYMALTTRCTIGPTTEALDHYFDQMAFVATVMDGVALTASSQQLRSTDGILLKLLLLSEVKS
ncbi:uncharacterized protein UHO2_06258 [Ustilago hordei]|uniref:Conserved uncharacterized protein n=1 Tax=Ustilago hordei TaxID=120017 RepID=I2FTJ8_USTHO|nr:uncharacterized protein UHO2_06258 [Ustilago hordei]CCF50241.1 conserved uncharacterized protein [Ustilago hordei]SYW87041.1 uncharacterized protein UHO2_06258 [Ustilago hordei]